MLAAEKGPYNNVSIFRDGEFENPKGYSREMPKEPLEYRSNTQESRRQRIGGHHQTCES